MFKPHHSHLVSSGRPRSELGTVRSGITGADVVVAIALVSIAVVVILMMLPRGREHARMASCQNNLAHIGRALAIYDELEHQLPTVSEVEPPGPAQNAQAKSPLRMLLDTLVQPNLLGIVDEKTPPPPRPGDVPDEVPVLGFTCSSDPNATAIRFPAPISYRACTGDLPTGENGAFRPGRAINRKEIESRDGLSFTAAFSERLVGDKLPNHVADCNYTIPDGALPANSCPPAAGASSWRGDAGSSWRFSDYRSTLYNHALRPQSRSSCIDGSGRSAFMGASSGHVQGVNLLLLDGRVMVVRPSIDLKIWREYARIGTAEPNQEGK